MPDGARFTLEQWEKAFEERRLRDLFYTGLSGGRTRSVVNSGDRVSLDVAEHPYHAVRYREENGRRDPGNNARVPRSNDERPVPRSNHEGVPNHSGSEMGVPDMGRFR
jgi:hypothetical protein